MEGFGARVALARGKVGWTRRELAKRASLHEQHLGACPRIKTSGSFQYGL